jgi:hypothetical protein
MNVMEIDKKLEALAIEEALQKFPQFTASGPKLVAKPLFRGFALMLEYAEPPEPGNADAWEFQNAAVKAYKRLAG